MDNNYRYSDNNYTYTYDHIPDVPGNNDKKPMPFWKKALTAVALGLLFGAFAGAGIYVAGLLTGVGPFSGNSVASDSKAAEPAPTPAPETSAPTENKTPAATISGNTMEDRGDIDVVPTTTATVTVKGATDVSEVAENVMPAVVSITNNYIQTAQDIFGQRYQAESEAAGSGIIVGDNGDELLVVTNQHVVDDAETLRVQFIDETEVTANLKGEDEDSDLAVIAINKADLSAETKGNIKIASLGDSEHLKVGQTAIAIGNAMGYGQSVTVGVISAVDRDLTLSNGTHKMIQTDAAINPGNSGGALVDVNGNVIGINEAKLSNSVVEGMGYAIPISRAREIIDGLMNQSTKTKIDENERGYLGISGVDVTSEISEQYNMPRGVYIAKVGSGLAADNAGITAKSIITSFDGQSVQTMEQLQSLMQYYKIGDTVDVVIQKPVENGYGYEEQTCHVTLGGNMSMNTNSDSAEDSSQSNEDQGSSHYYFYHSQPFDDIFGNIW